jgi:UDPglucose 6-dehydrogenase
MGYVGGAMVKVLTERGIEVLGIDTQDPSSLAQYARLGESELVFVCVPTPYSPLRGDYDYSIVNEVIRSLDGCGGGRVSPTICLRSTVAPDFFDMHDNIHAYWPEFLRADSAAEDFANPDVLVAGYLDPADGEKLGKFWERAKLIDSFHDAIWCRSREDAAALKLIHNSYAALRISFLNEVFIAAKKELSGAGFMERLRDVFTARGLGENYTAVPGPDGNLGFAGACFPKDLSAFIGYLRRLELPSTLAEATREVNSCFRLPG